MLFSQLGLAEPLMRAVSEEGYETPTPIQQQAIPAVLEGRDVMAAAQTGTGKTAGFTLPMLNILMDGSRPGKHEVRALVLTPTRELAAQVAESVATYGKYIELSSSVVFGGVSINPQIKTLARGVDILVATPGRLLDLHQQKAVDLSKIEILVLDEADRMLDMGFIHDIRRVLKLLPNKRQNLLFSATFSKDIVTLAKGFINDPVEVSVAARNTTAETVDQSVYKLAKHQKTAMLTHLIKSGKWFQVLVFTRTKHGANRLADRLGRSDITAAAIHGNKSQNARTRALADFKDNKIQVLVATDIAARGLDIDQLPHVVNFELPNVAEDYVHRIGRTGRAGASGEAVSLVEPSEVKLLRGIEKLINKGLTVEPIPDEIASMEAPKKTEEPARGERRNSGGRGRNNNQKNGASRGNGDRQSRPGRDKRKPAKKQTAAGNGNGNGNGNSNNSNNRKPAKKESFDDAQPVSNENRSAVELATMGLSSTGGRGNGNNRRNTSNGNSKRRSSGGGNGNARNGNTRSSGNGNHKPRTRRAADH